MTGTLAKIGCWGCVLVCFAVLGGCGGGGTSDVASTQQQTAKDATQETTAPKGETTVPEIFKDRGPLECPSHSAESIGVTLDADPYAENIGVMMAESKRFYENAGLSAFTGGPKNPARSVKYVALGVDGIGVAQQPQVLLATEEAGAPLLAIGSVIKQNNAAMIWLPGSGINDVTDLAGKTIGIPGAPFQEAFLEEVLARAGLTLEDVTIKRTNFRSVDALLEERVDALFGVTWNNEGAALEARGADPVIKRAQSLGLPDYEELVVIAPAKCVAQHPAVYRDFMAAVGRGIEAVQHDPAAAANLIKANYGIDSRLRVGSDVRAPVKATLPQLTSDLHMDLGQVAHLADWMYEKGILDRKPPVHELFSNDYLAP